MGIKGNARVALAEHREHLDRFDTNHQACSWDEGGMGTPGIGGLDGHHRLRHMTMHLTTPGFSFVPEPPAPIDSPLQNWNRFPRSGRGSC